MCSNIREKAVDSARHTIGEWSCRLNISPLIDSTEFFLTFKILELIWIDTGIWSLLLTNPLFFSPDPPPGKSADLLSSLFVFDPATWLGSDPLAVQGTPPSPRQGHGFASVGYTLFVHGGGGVCNSGMCKVILVALSVRQFSPHSRFRLKDNKKISWNILRLHTNGALKRTAGVEATFR